MTQEYLEIAFRLVAALFAGGLIGLERSYRGRSAGFRTHALVCLASSLLMLVTVYESHWFQVAAASRFAASRPRHRSGSLPLSAS
jgi:putative Mg2+ transporter-C (MgtC) family protein